MAWLSRNRLLSQKSNRHSASSHIFTIYGFNSSDREREMKEGNAEYCAHYLSHTERRWSRKYTHICWEPHTVLRWDSHFRKQLQWREREQTMKQLGWQLQTIKMIFPGLCNWSLMFVILTTVCKGYENIAVTKLIAETWEHYDNAKKQSHMRQRNKKSSTARPQRS